jgi:hypothetical protein
MKTILTKKQQADFLAGNHKLSTLVHIWSTRGSGSSKFVDKKNDLIGNRVTGCGFDRAGTALGTVIAQLFPDEVLKLATGRNIKDFYGLFYNKETKKAFLDGGCGWSCMIKILNKIGFSLKFDYEFKSGTSGRQIYTLQPITKRERSWS